MTGMQNLLFIKLLKRQTNWITISFIPRRYLRVVKNVWVKPQNGLIISRKWLTCLKLFCQRLGGPLA